MEPKQRPTGAKEYADKIRARAKRNLENLGKPAAPDSDHFWEPRKVPVVLDDGTTILHEFGGRKVTLSPDGTVVTKEGLRISPSEVDALEAAGQAGIPCPKPYGPVQKLDDTHNSYKMSFIPGERLDKVWCSMSAEEKSSIALQLRNILDRIRALEPPPDLVGGCGGTNFRHIRSYDWSETPTSFKDEAGFNEWLMQELYERTPMVLREALRSGMRTDHRIVLTHGDLSQHNILVQDGKITGLIDWEFAGWLPEYWDYVNFAKRPPINRDWRDYASIIFSQRYDSELVHFLALSQLLQG
ncbi:kinase-like domain-containing protein [Nemania sp. FL0916]|nr:kinase-like domain-containing protein [Nemania sp. FL0916]